MTKEQAIALANSGFWKEMTPQQIAAFQINEPLLCMPFDVFRGAVETTLGRPVWSHEFAFMDKLRKEIVGDTPAPTFQEILDLIPAEKRIVVEVRDGDEER